MSTGLLMPAFGLSASVLAAFPSLAGAAAAGLPALVAALPPAAFSAPPSLMDLGF